VPRPRIPSWSPAAPHHVARRPDAGQDDNLLLPLDAADIVFRALVTGPQPLSLNPRELHPRFPDRMVPLDEMKAILLHPATSGTARNKVWAELVRRARTGEPAWMVALTGVAMPGLRRASNTWRATLPPGELADLQSEILSGFLIAVRALDLDDLDNVRLAARLCWAAWRAGRAHALAAAGWAARRHSLPVDPETPAVPWGHPDFVLASAVRAAIISASDADLIGRNRLEGVPLAQIAAELGISHPAACNRRARAERRLTAAIIAGQITSWPLQ
jgi:hypothetical protein